MTDNLTFVEIDIDYCSLNYGNAPCTAAIDVDNPDKCVNALSPCQDRANFTNAPVTLRFAMPFDKLPRDISAIPNIKSVDFTPGKISLGTNLGQRSSLKVSFSDHPHSDAGEGFDKYVSERAYNPYEQGTFWGKFRARQPYLRGRPMRWITGTTDQDIGDMETRLFLIESFSGPNLDGTYTITAKDVLKMADGDRALAPLPSNGILGADIDESTTSVVLSPTGIGDAEYPASGYQNFGGKEIVAFTRTSDNLTLTRGQYNTEATAHSAGSKCQLCLDYTSMSPADVSDDLIANYTSISDTYINLANWQAEVSSYYRRLVSALIVEPTPVNTLLSELIEQCGLAIWWDDVTGQIQLRVLRAISTDAELFDDSNIIEGSLRIDDQPGKLITQTVVPYGLDNPLKSLENPTNFRAVEGKIQVTEQAAHGSPSIKWIPSRWIPFGGLAIATRIIEIQLGRFLRAPRKFRFAVARYGSTSPTLGEGCLISGLMLQSVTGASVTVPIQITRINPHEAIIEIEAEELRWVELSLDGLATRTLTLVGPAWNYDLKANHDQIFAAIPDQDAWSAGTYNLDNIVAHSGSYWIANTTTTEEPSDGATDWELETRVICIINDGVGVGSTTSGPAFDTGVWPTGLVPIIINNGIIQGIGGGGGKGRFEDGWTDKLADNGGDGGKALLVQSPIDLDNTNGEILGGAGGGGGGGSNSSFWGLARGGSGGGGAGRVPGTSRVIANATGVDGTNEDGGAGGPGYLQGGGTVGNGGEGGDPGQAGGSGVSVPGGGAASGGAAGAAIDGVSDVTFTAAGTITGPQIN